MTQFQMLEYGVAGIKGNKYFDRDRLGNQSLGTLVRRRININLMDLVQTCQFEGRERCVPLALKHVSLTIVKTT